MASSTTAKETKPTNAKDTPAETKADPKALLAPEEDDEFEDFPAEGNSSSFSAKWVHH
jgi:hypothetical protein